MYVPFRRCTLLLDLGENTVGLIVDTMATGGQLSVALDLLFPTHVASLSVDAGYRQSHICAWASVARQRELTLAILLRLASAASSSRIG